MKRIIVDTNVIVGFLVRKEKLLSDVIEKYDELIVPTLVVLEVVYVLEKKYELTRKDIVGVLVVLLGGRKVQCERLLLINSLLKFRVKPQLSFVDCYLGELAEELNCGIITGDKDLKKLAGHTL
jgi:predicted nucleic acid-binding protein